MDFILIQPDNLRSVWPQVREGLDKLPPEDWIAEDVYHLVKAGQAALYIAVTDEGIAGFFVLRRLVAEFSKEPQLHVWIGYNAGDADVFTAAEGFIRHLAQQSGAKRITFASPRKGWMRRYPLIEATYEVPMESQK